MLGPRDVQITELFEWVKQYYLYTKQNINAQQNIYEYSYFGCSDNWRVGYVTSHYSCTVDVYIVSLILLLACVIRRKTGNKASVLNMQSTSSCWRAHLKGVHNHLLSKNIKCYMWYAS